MFVTCEWYDADKTVLYWKYDSVWTWGDAAIAQKRCHELIDSVSGTVHSIQDLSQSNFFPLGALHKLPEFIKRQHPRRGITLIIVNPQSAILPLWRTFSILIPNARKQSLIFLTSLAEVDEYLKQMRENAESQIV